VNDPDGHPDGHPASEQPDPGQYGASFADVYDDWYSEPSPSTTIQTVATLAALAGSGPVLELGVGTGRLAVPLAARGLEVWGIDSSPEMLTVLATKPGAEAVHVECRDMAAQLPAGPFSLVFIAFNTFFNLLTDHDQRACFGNVRDVLTPNGVFAVETFVAEDAAAIGEPLRVDVKAESPRGAVLMVTASHGQRVDGEHIELQYGHPIRRRPWSIRWSTLAQLDAMAEAAGLTVRNRWATWQGERFEPTSTGHVTVYGAQSPTPA
jgi:SAM-dependent methyltransferase